MEEQIKLDRVGTETAVENYWDLMRTHNVLINRMHLWIDINYTDGSVHLAIWSTFDEWKLRVYFAGTWLAAMENDSENLQVRWRKNQNAIVISLLANSKQSSN